MGRSTEKGPVRGHRSACDGRLGPEKRWRLLTNRKVKLVEVEKLAAVLGVLVRLQSALSHLLHGGSSQ